MNKEQLTKISKQDSLQEGGNGNFEKGMKIMEDNFYKNIMSFQKRGNKIMKNNFYADMAAFREKEDKTITDYLDYIKTMTYIEISEYNSNYSYTALDLNANVEIIADYFTKLGFKCNYYLDNDCLKDKSIFYRFYLYW